MKKPAAKISSPVKAEVPVQLKKSRKIAPIFFLTTLLVAAGVLAYYYFTQINADLFKKPPLSEADETRQTITAVSKLMLLPTGETPTVATVGDVTKLSTQAFFANSINGDKVLIYNTAKKAILWRPSTNMIIEVAPITVMTSDSSGTATDSAAAKPEGAAGDNAEKISFILYNGAGVTGLTKTYETSLKAKIAGVTVAARENAATVYDKSVLIDVKGDKMEQAGQLSRKLGITLGGLPKNEKVTATADFLIILGKDQVK
jgi:hypothetical protein